MEVSRNGNQVIVSDPLGFSFDDGRLVLTLLQARELEAELGHSKVWLSIDSEEGVDHEDG